MPEQPEEQCQRTDHHAPHIWVGLHETSPQVQTVAQGFKLTNTLAVEILCPGITGPSRS